MHIFLHAAGTQRFGKTELVVNQVKTAMREGKNVVVCCKSQADSVRLLAPHFPGALLELVNNWGIRVHERAK